MPEFTKGGRGKQAPYDSTHCRVPEPCKQTVQVITDTWKHLLSNDEGEAKTQNLLKDVQNLVTMHYIGEFSKPVTKLDELFKDVKFLLLLLKGYKENCHETSPRFAKLREFINLCDENDAMIERLLKELEDVV